MKIETITPYASSANKQQQIRETFNRIAPRYDLLNRLLSFGIDITWRKRALRHLKALQPANIIDIATGTADMPIMAAKALPHATFIGVDFSAAMLQAGNVKIQRHGVQDRIQLIEGDALALPCADHSFAAAISAFGVRNFADIVAGIREMRRVLKPGGTVIILELSRPEHFPMRQMFHFYMRFIMPLFTRFFSRHAREYRYLPTSIQYVPQGIQMLAILRQAGFINCVRHSYTGGICSCYIGQNSADSTT